MSSSKINGDGMTLSLYDPSNSLGINKKSFTEIISNDNQIFGITEDLAGNIWFGTVKGVCRYNPSVLLLTDEKSFTYFTEIIE